MKPSINSAVAASRQAPQHPPLAGAGPHGETSASGLDDRAALPAATTLEISRDGAVTSIWLARPDVRNAFNEIAIAEIGAAFEQAGADPATRVIVLGGQGSAFCAGGDLHWMKKMAGYSHQENLADAAGLANMLRIVHECPKPVIARVQGDCYAGGVGLAAVCDIVVAVSTANFCLSETRIGLIPATIAPYVIRAMGMNAARRYFLTAEPFSAQQAQELGFVHEVTSALELDAVVARIARALCAASPEAVRQSKLLVREIGGRPIDAELINDTVARIAAIRASEQGREGVAAFLEKRKPAWLAQR